MEANWIKVTDKLPEEGKEYLVWTGYIFIVSDATFYGPGDFADIPSELVLDQLKAKGYFREFGQKYYFDNEQVQYTELPSAPK